MLRDPAHKAVRTLEKKGIRLIVLPRAYLITGDWELVNWGADLKSQRGTDCLIELGVIF